MAIEIAIVLKQISQFEVEFRNSSDWCRREHELWWKERGRKGRREGRVWGREEGKKRKKEDEDCLFLKKKKKK